MPKRHRGEQDEGTPGGDDREPGLGAQRPVWQTGRLPRMPRDPSDDEPDFITRWFRGRSLDDVFEDRAQDQERPRDSARRLRRSPERWATGSPWHSRQSAASDDLPDYEAECEDPPDRERL
jgi:hypothetical protein